MYVLRLLSVAAHLVSRARLCSPCSLRFTLCKKTENRRAAPTVATIVTIVLKAHQLLITKEYYRKQIICSILLLLEGVFVFVVELTRAFFPAAEKPLLLSPKEVATVDLKILSTLGSPQSPHCKKIISSFLR